MNNGIRRITADKKQYLNLLLLADEQESMIDHITSNSQRQGDGKKRKTCLLNHYADKYNRMIAGTGEISRTVEFYKNWGWNTLTV